MFCCFRLKKTMLLLLAAALITGIALISIKAAAAALTGRNSHAGVFVPAIMYHSVLKDETKTGDYVVTPITLEKDLLYLYENGYTAVFVSDIISYVFDGGQLPEKPVLLTFDDGFYNNLEYVLPLLRKYEMKAVFSIVGEYTQSFSDSGDKSSEYAYLSWEDISLMEKSGLCEFVNHSYAMHSTESRQGALRLENESPADYKNIFIADTMRFSNALYDNCKIKTEGYTFPFGFYNQESADILRSLGFKAYLTCYEKPNYITKADGGIIKINRYNRPSEISTEDFMKKLLTN